MRSLYDLILAQVRPGFYCVFFVLVINGDWSLGQEVVSRRTGEQELLIELGGLGWLG